MEQKPPFLIHSSADIIITKISFTPRIYVTNSSYPSSLILFSFFMFLDKMAIVEVAGRKFDVPVYTTQEIYEKAQRLLNMSGYKRRVRNLAVSVYDLIPTTDEQLELFASPKHAVSEAMDEINDRWGEFVITPALMMGMDDVILDRIAFGGVKELQELYTE
jgi:impB/mucB/samB family protein